MSSKFYLAFFVRRKYNRPSQPVRQQLHDRNLAATWGLYKCVSMAISFYCNLLHVFKLYGNSSECCLWDVISSKTLLRTHWRISKYNETYFLSLLPRVCARAPLLYCKGRRLYDALHVLESHLQMHDNHNVKHGNILCSALYRMLWHVYTRFLVIIYTFTLVQKLCVASRHSPRRRVSVLTPFLKSILGDNLKMVSPVFQQVLKIYTANI